MIKASSWSVKGRYLAMALLMVASLVVVMAAPVAADVVPDGVIIASPTTAAKAFVQSGGTVDVQFDVETNDEDFGDIQVEVRKGANLIGTTVVAYYFSWGSNDGLVYQVNIPATAAAGLYDVIVWARQPQGTGTWQSDSQTDAVRVDNTVPPAPALVSPASGLLTNVNEVALNWSDVTDPSTPVGYQVQVDDDANFGSPEYDSAWIGDSAATTSALDDGLYYWRARAVDGAGNEGAWSAVRTFTVDATPPAVPGLVSPPNGATLANNYTPALDWSSVTDPSGVTYDVQVDDDPGFGSLAVNETELAASAYTVPAPGLGAALYYWQAQAVDDAGNASGWSAVRTFTITDTIAPPAPTLVSPVDGLLTNVNEVALNWSDVDDPSGLEYQVQVAATADFSPPVYESWIGDSAATTDPLDDGLYYWRARAVDGEENEGDWSAVRTFTVDTTAPDAPTLLSPDDGATLVNNPTPALDWSDVDDPSGVTYNVQVDGEVDETELTASAYTVPAPGLAAGTYDWYVQAVDGAGNTNGWSERTFTITDTIAPPAPTLVSPADGAFTNDPEVALDWSDVDDPSDVVYQVQVDDDADFSSLEYESWIGDSEATTDLLLVGTYNWRAQAVDGADNEGDWSAVRTFTVDATEPAAPTLLLPATGATLTTPTPTLDWSDVTDPSGVTYTVQVDTDDAFAVPILINVPELALSTFGPTLADGVYYWHVQAVDGAGNTSAWSATWYFRIAADPIAPTVTVIGPNGGENWQGSSSQLISWTATDNLTPPLSLSITLRYSINGGTTWIPIATGEVNDGAYLWTVPPEDSTQCLVRVEATDISGNTGSDTSNGLFSITTAVPPTTSISLAAGWNLVSLPLIPTSSAISTVLSGVSANVLSVWYYDASTASWLSWNPTTGGDLTTMVDGKGYWINMSAAGTLTVSGSELLPPPAVPPTYSVVTGWNLVGFKSTTAKTVGTYLTGTDYRFSIYGYSGGYQTLTSNSDSLQPGQGYWVYFNADGTITP